MNRRGPGRRYLGTHLDGKVLELEYWPREDLPTGLSLTRFTRWRHGEKLGQDTLVYESIGLTHDATGLSVKRWGGPTKADKGPWKSGQALREARDWITKHRADLDEIDWTWSREELAAQPAVRLLLGLPELETA